MRERTDLTQLLYVHEVDEHAQVAAVAARLGLRYEFSETGRAPETLAEWLSRFTTATVRPWRSATSSSSLIWDSMERTCRSSDSLDFRA